MVEMVPVFSDDRRVRDAQVAALLVSVADQHGELLGEVLVAALFYASDRLLGDCDDDDDEVEECVDVSGLPSGWRNTECLSSKVPVSCDDVAFMFQ